MQTDTPKIEVRAVSGIPETQLARVREAVDQLHYLNHVVNWCATQQQPCTVKDAVTQDEFTHDVILQFGANEDELYIVFDAT